MLVNESEILYTVQQESLPCPVELPGYDEHKGYKIDLQTRKVEAPPNLGVLRDHNSSVCYFVVDRFYDYMDLSTLPCVIHYVTSDGEPHIYPVKFYDIDTLSDYRKMIIPWNVDKIVTQYTGDLLFSFRFFKVQQVDDFNTKLIYNLNTLEAKTTILPGLNAIIPAEKDLKPCVCENTLPTIEYIENQDNHVCTIKCSNEDCDYEVVAAGETKLDAFLNASYLWNGKEYTSEIKERKSYQAEMYEILTTHIQENKTYWTIYN